MAIDTTQPLLVLMSQGLVPANGQNSNGQSIMQQISQGQLPDSTQDTQVPVIVNASG